jgi:hypothetical protein
MNRKLLLSLAGATAGAFMVFSAAQAAPATGSLDALKTLGAEPSRAGSLLAPLLARLSRLLALPPLVSALVIMAGENFTWAPRKIALARPPRI